MLSRSWRHGAISWIVVLMALCMSGCIRIQVIDRTPSIAQPTPSRQVELLDEHNLAVLAVDFDPPLEYKEIVSSKNRGEGITLLVAIENTGSVAETDVVVEVELYKGCRFFIILNNKNRTIYNRGHHISTILFQLVPQGAEY